MWRFPFSGNPEVQRSQLLPQGEEFPGHCPEGQGAVVGDSTACGTKKGGSQGDTCKHLPNAHVPANSCPWDIMTSCLQSSKAPQEPLFGRTDPEPRTERDSGKSSSRIFPWVDGMRMQLSWSQTLSLSTYSPHGFILTHSFIQWIVNEDLLYTRVCTCTSQIPLRLRVQVCIF